MVFDRSAWPALAYDLRRMVINVLADKSRELHSSAGALDERTALEVRRFADACWEAVKLLRIAGGDVP